MYITNPYYLDLQSNVFISNKAYNDSTGGGGFGGAIFFTCDPEYNCRVDIRDINHFNYNEAENAGGAIKWDPVEPNFDGTTVYSSNTAGLYGDDIASFA